MQRLPRPVAIAGVFIALCALVLGVFFVGNVGSAGASPQAASASSASSVSFLHSCGPAKPGHARCHAIVRVNNRHYHPTPTPTTNGPTPTATTAPSPTPTMIPPTPTATISPPTPTPTGTGGGGFPTTCPNPSNGYTPCDLASAYNLMTASVNNGAGQTIAIVDAYDDPNAEADLGVFRSEFGLPACTTANGCFRKVNESGGTSYPTADGGWAQEESLDVDMVSSICPNCHILLVEASSTSYSDLGTSVNEAVKLGANAVSNSYGGSESLLESSYDSYYDHPGVAITVSSGDSGYGVEYPAASPYVTAVGGTSLSRASNARGWTETVWSTSSTEGAGSGCSAYESQQSWQAIANITSVCSNRAVADVAAVADPYTGVDVYDSYAYQGVSGWLVFGGTSVASPIIASVYGLAGNASSVNFGSFPYAHTGSLNDVTSGSTASCGSDLCAATTGWDGPTGLGTPNGTGGF